MPEVMVVILNSTNPLQLAKPPPPPGWLSGPLWLSDRTTWKFVQARDLSSPPSLYVWNSLRSVSPRFWGLRGKGTLRWDSPGKLPKVTLLELWDFVCGFDRNSEAKQPSLCNFSSSRFLLQIPSGPLFKVTWFFSYFQIVKKQSVGGGGC